MPHPSSGVVSTLDYRGVPATIAYTWLPELQVCQIVKMDQSEAFAPVRFWATPSSPTGWYWPLAAMLGSGWLGALPGRCVRPAYADHKDRARAISITRSNMTRRRARQDFRRPRCNEMPSSCSNSRRRAGSRQQGTGSVCVLGLARPARAAEGHRRLLTHPD